MKIPKSDAANFLEQVRLNQQKLAAGLKSHYDFIVCGAGTSGSVVAAPELVECIEALLARQQTTTRREKKTSSRVPFSGLGDEKPLG